MYQMVNVSIVQWEPSVMATSSLWITTGATLSQKILSNLQFVQLVTAVLPTLPHAPTTTHVRRGGQECCVDLAMLGIH